MPEQPFALRMKSAQNFRVPEIVFQSNCVNLQIAQNYVCVMWLVHRHSGGGASPRAGNVSARTPRGGSQATNFEGRCRKLHAVVPAKVRGRKVLLMHQVEGEHCIPGALTAPGSSTNVEGRYSRRQMDDPHI